MTQKEAILKYLQSGNSITGLEALRLFGTMKLATRISELRRDGIEIMHQMVNRNDKWVAKYFIIPEVSSETL
jgi:sulfur transfer protein SufE